MTWIATHIQNDLHLLIQRCYGLDTFLTETAAGRNDYQLRDHLERQASFYKSLGDHLFLILSAERLGLEPPVILPDIGKTQWLGRESLTGVNSDSEILEKVRHGQSGSAEELQHLIEQKDLPPDVALVLQKGLLEINGILDRVRTLEDLDAI